METMEQVLTEVHITARPKRGFYRCRMFHPSHLVVHDPDEFSLQDLERLQAEPKLQVELVFQDVEPKPEPKPEPKRKAKSGGKKSAAKKK